MLHPISNGEANVYACYHPFGFPNRYFFEKCSLNITFFAIVTEFIHSLPSEVIMFHKSEAFQLEQDLWYFTSFLHQMVGSQSPVVSDRMSKQKSANDNPLAANFYQSPSSPNGKLFCLKAERSKEKKNFNSIGGALLCLHQKKENFQTPQNLQHNHVHCF